MPVPAMKRKPVHTARAGQVAVTVYRNGPGRYGITWRKTAGGARVRETFASRADAVRRAEALALALLNGRADVLELTHADRDDYREARRILAPLGLPLHAALEEYAAAKKLIGDHTLAEAARFFARGHLERLECPPTADILAALLAEMTDDQRSARRTIAPARRDLEKFAASFPDIREADEPGIRAYLSALRRQADGKPVSLRRRDAVRDIIARLMRFARKREWLPEKPVAAERIPRLSTGAEVTTYTPRELAAMLDYFTTHDRAWLPWCALAAFAGLRTSEIFRLDWSAFRWEQGVIAIASSVARKVRTARKPPILPALAAWLAPWRASTGSVIAIGRVNLDLAQWEVLARMRQALGWKAWKINALRHSYGSYRLAVLQDTARTALEMGNSPAMVFKHYNDCAARPDAESWFATLPPAEAGGKIIQLAQG